MKKQLKAQRHGVRRVHLHWYVESSPQRLVSAWSYTGFIRLSRVLWLSVLVVMLGGLLEPEAAAQTVSFGAKTDFGTGSFPDSVAVGDFNGDGNLDLAVANNSSATVSILLGTGTGSFGAKTDFGTNYSPNSVAVSDFNGDGKLDLAVANDESETVSILLGTGTGSFGAKTDFGTGSCAAPVAFGDFNGDGKLDLAVANGCSNTVSILLGTGTGSLGTDFGTGSFASSVAVRVAVDDFNGDGKLDLALAGSNTVSILLGTGTGSFGAKTDFGTGSYPASVAVGDFNGDGKLDVAVANNGSATVSILLGTGTGSFGAKTDFDAGSYPTSVAVGDFNGDGKLDLAVANQGGSNTVSILLGTGTGSFGAKTDFGTGSFPYSVAVGDFNGDGKFDLVVANLRSDTVSILLNTTVYRIANSVSAASFQGGTLAAGAIAAAFGSGLATQTLAAELPLPTTLAGTQVRVRDSAGIERLAPIFFVSPEQVNYLLPEGISAGRAEVSITSGAGVVSSGLVQIASVAPGVFSANSNGTGVVAGYITRVRAGVITGIEDVTVFDATKNQYTARAVDLGPANEEVFLTLFGTGIHHRTSLAGVVVRVGGEEQQVTYADVQRIYVGLDQINLRLARSLAGRGEVDIVLAVDRKAANTVTVNIK